MCDAPTAFVSGSALLLIRKNCKAKADVRLADIPARGQGSLVEMNDFHAGLRTGWWESMKALFRPQAKSGCGINMGVGSTARFGIELTPAFSMRPTIRI
jgi:hypothetical protein